MEPTMTKFILVLLCTMLASCGVNKVTVKSSDVIDNQYANFSPANNWWTSTGTGWKLMYQGTVSETDKTQYYYMNSEDSLSTIGVRTEKYPDPYQWGMEVDKHAFLERYSRELTEKEEKDRKMKAILSTAGWLTNFANAQCTNGVTVRGAHWREEMMLTKEYYMICRYYDKNEANTEYQGRRKIVIEYDFLTSGYGEREVLYKREQELIKAVQGIMKTLVIKNIDVERMKLEGIYYENEPFYIPERVLIKPN